jgi:hypothetical protein
MDFAEVARHSRERIGVHFSIPDSSPRITEVPQSLKDANSALTALQVIGIVT